jgi:hypothetical protein
MSARTKRPRRLLAIPDQEPLTSDMIALADIHERACQRLAESAASAVDDETLMAVTLSYPKPPGMPRPEPNPTQLWGVDSLIAVGG